jgi:hypothetical protein
MSLTQKFRDAVLDSAVRICNLDMEKPYLVILAERVETKYGVSILLTIRENINSCVKVFLPRRYSLYFSEGDILATN